MPFKISPYRAIGWRALFMVGASACGSGSGPAGPLADGRTGQIAFVRRDGTVNHIYLMDIDGAGRGATPRRLTTSTEVENYPSWSTDGRQLVYQLDRGGAAIYLANADGTGQRRLSPTPGFDVTPSFSPDGTQIVYVRLQAAPAPGHPPRGDIRIMNLDGSGDHAILADALFAVEPRWSSRGMIVFMSYLSGEPGLNLHVMNADGSGLRQLTTNAGNNGDPVWSPDGSTISFGSDRQGGDTLNIFAMNLDSSALRRLTSFVPPDEAGDTNWSGDGRFITFERDANGKKQSNPDAVAVVWTMASDGSDPRSTGVECAAVGCAPRWRP